MHAAHGSCEFTGPMELYQPVPRRLLVEAFLARIQVKIFSRERTYSIAGQISSLELEDGSGLLFNVVFSGGTEMFVVSTIL